MEGALVSLRVPPANGEHSVLCVYCTLLGEMRQSSDEEVEVMATRNQPWP